MTESKKREKEFLEEISGFNRDFSLGGSEEDLIGSRKQSQTLELDREVDALRKGAQTLLSSAGRLDLNSCESHTQMCVFPPPPPGRDGADEQQRLSAELCAGGEEETQAGAAGSGRCPDR